MSVDSKKALLEAWVQKTPEQTLDMLFQLYMQQIQIDENMVLHDPDVTGSSMNIDLFNTALGCLISFERGLREAVNREARA